MVFVFLSEVHSDLLCLFRVKFKTICTAPCRCLIVVGYQACQAFIVRIFHQDIIAVFSDRLTVRCVQRKEYQRDHRALRSAGVCCDDGGCDIAYFHILVPVGKEIMNPKYKLRTDVHVMQVMSH